MFIQALRRGATVTEAAGKAGFGLRPAGSFPALEDQLAGMTPAGYEGGSPDRADAMVWATNELFARRKAAPSNTLL